MGNYLNSQELEHRIGYEFKNKELLKLALTHSSFSNELKVNKYGDYERLEFLGDAVLELSSSEFFYNAYPDMKEGQLTRLRSSMVCEKSLAFCAKEFELNKYILLGKGEEHTGGRERDSIISDVFEALLGAMYLDSDFDTAKRFVVEFVLKDLEDKQIFFDSKTMLQEWSQKEGKGLTYELVSESGPDHEKDYVINVLVDGQIMGTGNAHSKKMAEQNAAFKALEVINLKK